MKNLIHLIKTVVKAYTNNNNNNKNKADNVFTLCDSQFREDYMNL